MKCWGKAHVSEISIVKIKGKKSTPLMFKSTQKTILLFVRFIEFKFFSMLLLIILSYSWASSKHLKNKIVMGFLDTCFRQ